MIETPFKYST